MSKTLLGKAVCSFDLCYCGYPKNPHMFRHKFKPKIELTRCKTLEKMENSQNEFYTVNGSDFPSIKIEGRCKVPQCGAIKNLHGSIIKHKFVSNETIYVRDIKIKLPLDAKCQHVDKIIQEDILVSKLCNKPLNQHTSPTHAFSTYLMIKERQNHDVITIIGKNSDQTIVNLTYKE